MAIGGDSGFSHPTNNNYCKINETRSKGPRESRSFSNIAVKKLEDNPQTGKENSFILPASFCPPGQTAQCPEEPPQPETVLLTGKRIAG